MFKKVIFCLVLSSGLSFAQEKTEKYNPHSIQSHGYLRTGLGATLEGGEMVQFQAPESTYKSRFGNEANHYSELQFDYKYQEQNSDQSYEIVYMMTAYLEYASLKNTQSIQPETAQLYFKWNNIYKDMDIWVGRRYFQRLNVDILDNFWLNPAQNSDVGVGVEQIPMPNDTELDASLILVSKKLEDPSFKEEARIKNYKFDLRYKNIKLNDKTELNLLTQFGFRPELSGHNYYKKMFGLTLGSWGTYTQGNFYNRTSAIYRQGINMIENPYSGRNFLEFNADGRQVYDMDKAYDWQLTSDFRYDNFDTFGFLGVIAYQNKFYGVKTPQGNDRVMSHLNVTGRFSRYLGKNFRLTLDNSYDYVDITDDAHGSLFKFTISPEFSWKKGMFSRPSLRPFITYATWSQDLKGKVGVFNGNNILADKTGGFTAGLQLELWW